jgi:uncharacterized protein
MKSTIKDKTALVTGASGGIGAAIARELGSCGANLVLVARREDFLRKVADGIKRDFGVRADILVKDLQDPKAPDEIHTQIKRSGAKIDVLVNNAGFGVFGKFIDIPYDREREMLNLDIIALVHMSKLFARDMAERGSGFIMQIASIGAFQPSPLYASYSAAKAFVLSFGEAIHQELRGSGVSVTVVSPGVTESEFLKVAGQEPNRYQRMAMMPAEKVARIAVRAMLKKKSSVVTGRLNSISVWSNRLVPRNISAAIAGRLMK